MRTPGLPAVWDLNVVRADRPPQQDAAALQTAVEQALPAAAVPHVELGAGAGALVEALAGAGWLATDLEVMALREPAGADAGDGAVVRLTLDEVAPAFEAYQRSEPWGQDPAARAQAHEALRRLDAAQDGHLLGLRDAGEVVSWCRVWHGDGIAQIDDVVTLPHARRRGHARAVVSAALRGAAARGSALVFIVADAGDWPRDLYARLGFERIGLVHRLRRFP